MTDILVLLGSAVGVAFMVWLAQRFGHSKRAEVSEADLDAALSEVAPGAAVTARLVDLQGRAALAQLEDGRLVVVAGVADRVAVRLFSPSAIRAVTREPFSGQRAGVVIRFSDLGFPAVRLRYRSPDAPGWLERLLRAASSS